MLRLNPSSLAFAKPLVSCRFLSNDKKQQMINANELRIGNLINEKILGNVKILEIHNKVVVVEAINLTINKEKIAQNYTLSLNCIYPIRIDDEIIKKYWSVNKVIKLCKIKDIAMSIGTTEKRYSHFCIGDEYYIECLYLHQLQNIFFCITGKELSVVANGS